MTTNNTENVEVTNKKQKHNNEIDKLLGPLNEIALKGQKTELKERINLKHLLPRYSNYW
jgi:carbonic anhydrase